MQLKHRVEAMKEANRIKIQNGNLQTLKYSNWTMDHHPGVKGKNLDVFEAAQRLQGLVEY